MTLRCTVALSLLTAAAAACSLNVDKIGVGSDVVPHADQNGTTPGGGSDASATPPSGNADAGDAGMCRANLAEDTNNCGACGHSCFGAACAASLCQSERLTQVWGRMRVDATKVYATHKGALLVMDKTPFARPQLRTSDSLYLYDLAQDDNAVYASGGVSATGEGVIVRYAKSSNADPSPDLVTWKAPPGVKAHAIAVDGGYAYLLGQDGSIARVLKNAPANTVLTPYLPANTADFPLIADASHLFFNKDGSLKKVTTTDAIPAPVALADGSNRDVGQDEEALYYYASGNTIRRIAKSGGTPTILVTGTADAPLDPVQIFADAGHVYWTNLTKQALYSAPKGGGIPTLMADTQGTATLQAVDALWLYWIGTSGEGPNDGWLFRLAK